MQLKINRFLKKYSNPMMVAAGACIVIAMLLTHVWHLTGGATVCFLLAFALAGIPVLWRAYMGLRYKTISIELLVSIAAIGACFIKEFDESAIVTFLFQFGSYLEQRTIAKTRSAIKSLTEMAPKTAWKMDGESLEEIDVDEVEIGDRLLVKTGGQIASDGIVVEGEGYVMEASITGESTPVYKKVGDCLYAGTLLDSGTLQMEATKVGEDTTFSKIIALVEEAQDAKSPVERFIDRFAKYYTPAVVVLAVLVFVITRNVDTAITVLVLACPGALVIGAPIANVAGIGRGAKEGILLKGGESIHTFSRSDTVMLDKTGTLTYGSPRVIDKIAYSKDLDSYLPLLVSAERMAEHPLAKALVEYVGPVELAKMDLVESVKGLGLTAITGRYKLTIGNEKIMEQNRISLSAQVLSDIETERGKGASIVLFAVDMQVVGLFAIADQIKEGAADSIEQLRKAGIRHIVMLTGDHVKTAEAVAGSIGIAEYQGDLLPDQKMEAIRDMQKEGHVVTFVGDGINDSPALAAADIGIAMGSGTDVAIETSDVVLLQSHLSSLAEAVLLSKRTERVLFENIVIAIGTVVLLLIGLFAGYVHMGVGMLIHEASILVVIFNAMRLLIVRRE